MKVTREQVLAIMPNAKDRVDAFLPYINGFESIKDKFLEIFVISISIFNILR